ITVAVPLWSVAVVTEFVTFPVLGSTSWKLPRTASNRSVWSARRLPLVVALTSTMVSQPAVGVTAVLAPPLTGGGVAQAVLTNEKPYPVRKLRATAIAAVAVWPVASRAVRFTVRMGRAPAGRPVSTTLGFGGTTSKLWPFNGLGTGISVASL